MATMTAFAVLAGGTAIAANQLGKKSVGNKQLKANAVTTAKIKKNAVTAAKIKDGAVDGSKVNDGSLGGGGPQSRQHALLAHRPQGPRRLDGRDQRNGVDGRSRSGTPRTPRSTGEDDFFYGTLEHHLPAWLRTHPETPTP